MKQLIKCRMDESCAKPGIRRSAGWLFVTGLLFYAILIGSSCQKAPAKPSNIGANDVCFYCKTPIDDKEVQFAAEFVTNTGFVRKFDDISCLLANARKVGRKNIEAFFVMDYDSKTWFPAEQVQFVRSDKIRTPENGGIVAFQKEARAQQVASQFKAELLKFDDIMK